MSTQPITFTVKERHELLLHRAEQLRRELQAARESAQPAASAAGTEVEDLKDRAAQSEASVVGDAEQERDRDELAQVEAALARLAAGRYGECADCGEPIGEARLAAMPAADCCAGCQAERERAHGRHSAGAAPRG
jgi:DnaK suppressor protein